MQALYSELEELGLSKEEAQVYLTVLELGGSFASTIASKAKLPRVNCYYILEALRRRNLVTSNLKGNVKFFVAEPPQVLVNQIQEKYAHAKKLLPQLLSLISAQAFKPIIRSYEGIEGIKKTINNNLSNVRIVSRHSASGGNKKGCRTGTLALLL